MSIHEKKILLFHTGARDYYHVARALYESGQLECLVTNAFKYQEPARLLKLLETVPAYMRRIASRRCPEIPDVIVKSHLLQEIMVHAASAVSGKLGDRVYAWHERVLAERAADIALNRRVEAVLSYSYCAYHLFSRLKGTGVRRILFQCHPQPDFVIDILRAEMKKNPKWSSTLLKEKELSWGSEYVAQLRAESQMADLVIAASSFTKLSLISNGVSAKKIVVVPYGSDSRLRRAREERPGKNRRQRILFVGQMGQRKGISYLIDACNKMDMTGRELRICGRGFDIDPAIRRERQDWLTIRRNLTETELADEYSNADVFVLPSLVEGFGLVILEALSFGLPVITTANTGGPDVMSDGIEGIIVPPGNSEALRDAILRILESDELAASMSAGALKVAERFRWREFRMGVAAAVRSDMHRAALEGQS